MSLSCHLLIERAIQGRAPFTRDVAEAILEVAYLAMRTDKCLADEEIDAFARAAGALLDPQALPGYRTQADSHRVAPPLEPREMSRWLDRFADRALREGAAERLSAAVARLADPEAKALAYQIARLIAVSDLDASDREFEFDLELIAALGLTQEDADRLADEVYHTVDNDEGPR